MILRTPLNTCARRVFEDFGFVQTNQLPTGALHFTHAGDAPGTLHELRSVRWGSSGVMAFGTTYCAGEAQHVHRVHLRQLHDLSAATRCYRQMARQLRPVEHALRRIFNGAAARNVALRVLESCDIRALLSVATASMSCYGSIVLGEETAAAGAGGGVERLEGNSPARLLWPRLFLRDWGVARATCGAAEYCRHGASELARLRGAEAAERRRARERLRLIELAHARGHVLPIEFLALPPLRSRW